MPHLTIAQVIGILTRPADAREQRIGKYVKYFDGRQDVVFDSIQKSWISSPANGQADSPSNICDIVVQTLNDRITIEGFRQDETIEGESDEYKKWVDTVFKDNRLEERQADLHRYILRDGIAGMFVEFEDDNVVLQPVPHFNINNIDKNDDYTPNVRFTFYCFVLSEPFNGYSII